MRHWLTGDWMLLITGLSLGQMAAIGFQLKWLDVNWFIEDET